MYYQSIVWMFASLICNTPCGKEVSPQSFAFLGTGISPIIFRIMGGNSSQSRAAQQQQQQQQQVSI
jgi:hypothetical protein